ncbi:Orotidine 5'-phosphate decarboxylase [Parelaphostrongylus tenuis]|uniref:Orotidine 5'-phosphate decarboxylase n=1 Tax=Parelaphostrongylus tenuis TaxID=148309 RepID=A0AAD5NDC6_PARTN|nr:Orotidine 5'-phosphate decarboxylase [Parelaphostrongylus tenuis]
MLLNNDQEIADFFSVSDMITAALRFDSNYHIRQQKKVLILGSGGLTIGQAGEFDYSGAQVFFVPVVAVI